MKIRRGPRGGLYYMKNGRKVYLKSRKRTKRSRSRRSKRSKRRSRRKVMYFGRMKFGLDEDFVDAIISKIRDGSDIVGHTAEISMGDIFSHNGNYKGNGREIFKERVKAVFNSINVDDLGEKMEDDSFKEEFLNSIVGKLIDNDVFMTDQENTVGDDDASDAGDENTTGTRVNYKAREKAEKNIRNVLKEVFKELNII